MPLFALRETNTEFVLLQDAQPLQLGGDTTSTNGGVMENGKNGSSS